MESNSPSRPSSAACIGAVALALLLATACSSSPAAPGPSDAGPPNDAGCNNQAVCPSDGGSDVDAGPVDGGDAEIPSCLGWDGGGTVTRLSVSGSKILDEHGNEIILRGWNWGEWGSAQEGDAYDNATQGATAVRIPVRWWGDYPDAGDSYDPSGPPYLDAQHVCTLDQTIGWAVKQHLWVILFLDSNCGQGSLTRDTVDACGAVDGGAPANFNNDPEMKARFTRAWAFLSARYSKVPYIGMYEILPEPNFTCGAHKTCPDWSIFPAFYASIIPTIRAADPRTPVLVGPGGAYNIDQIATSYIDGGSGIVYTGNLFEQYATDSASYAAALDFRSKSNVPVFIQQVGIRKSVPDAGAITDGVLTELKKDSFGWTWWTYREPNAPNGLGYAPLYKDSTGKWQTDDAWLQLIANHFHD